MKKLIGILALLIVGVNMGCSKSEDTPVDSAQGICYPDASVKKYVNIDNTKVKEFNAVSTIETVGTNVVFELEKTSCKTAVFIFSYDRIIGGIKYTISGAKRTINDLTQVSGNNYVGKLPGGISANLKLPTSVPSISDQIFIEYKEGDITYTFSGY